MSRLLNRKRRPDPAGLCHWWRGAEVEKSTWVNASSPRRGLHSGPGVNQSFVPASLRVNRFRCSICLQRLHVHARHGRPSDRGIPGVLRVVKRLDVECGKKCRKIAARWRLRCVRGHGYWFNRSLQSVSRLLIAIGSLDDG